MLHAGRYPHRGADQGQGGRRVVKEIDRKNNISVAHGSKVQVGRDSEEEKRKKKKH